MKTIMKISNYFILLLSAIVMISCGQSSTKSELAEEAKSEEVNETVSAILTAYFDVKEALVNDDASKAQEAANAMLAVTGTYAEALNLHVKNIAASDDIEAQRITFEILSINIYALAITENAGITVYKQFCPMAFDDKGAFWLSDNKQILNPYFGASMLRCGRVEETIN
ncbi:MAG TPA: DUF3347 domain-containing protein [Cyclobacteriaceae bacterium]|nr:DUF3347 domain-containing protein [Cyclobacteriaceae bacterium]